MSRALLVTGADSFIGSAFIRRIVHDSDIPVVAIYRHSQTRQINSLPANLQYVRCDLANPAEVNRLFENFEFETIVHAAGARPVLNEALLGSTAVRDTIQTTANLSDAAEKQRCRKFVFTSAIGVYDGIEQPADGFHEDMRLAPSTIFGWSKLAAENLMRLYTSYGMNLVTLRFPGVHGWGKNYGVVHTMLQRALRGAPLSISEPESRFRLLFIDDAVEALLLAVRIYPENSYTCFNVAGDEISTLPELAKEILSVTGSESEVLCSENSRARSQVLNTDLAKRELGFSPRAMRHHLTAFRDHLAADFDGTEQSGSKKKTS
jgi:dTDP-glucose 4,6-dehydratase